MATHKNTHMRCKDGLTAWMSNAKKINKKEFIVLSRFMHKLSPSASTDNMKTVLTFMSMVNRLEVAQTYAAELAVLHDTMDQALVKSYACWRADRTDPREWWQNHSYAASLVLDPARMGRAVAKNKKWLNVADDLEFLSNGSLIGEKLFGDSAMQVLNAKFAKDPGRLEITQSQKNIAFQGDLGAQKLKKIFLQKIKLGSSKNDFIKFCLVSWAWHGIPS